MHRSEKKVALVALAIMVIVVAACVAALCGCIPLSVEDVDAAMLPPEQTGQERELVTEHADGMPLDAISYDPPAWMHGCYETYRVYDRTNGEQWWVLVMGNGYVVLPIDC